MSKKVSNHIFDTGLKLRKHDGLCHPLVNAETVLEVVTAVDKHLQKYSDFHLKEIVNLLDGKVNYRAVRRALKHLVDVDYLRHVGMYTRGGKYGK
jgi:hypothetical protein